MKERRPQHLLRPSFLLGDVSTGAVYSPSSFSNWAFKASISSTE